MYKGFKKIFNNKSEVFHLGTDRYNSICGEDFSATQDGHCVLSEASDLPTDKRLCRKCRNKILNLKD